MLNTPMFESNGVLCVSTGSRGLYRCFTVNPSPAAPTPVSMASTPFIEVDDILCVSVADIGAYRCFQ
ncbi:hypothetical protein LSH36_1120g01004 [Paralvinella palmiformis]|uniref:Uncharacterized protein n=1 Tax=Paralvinella palmiformis TaxID=53620 RepID=A0AAD9IVY6_9ANNE|nr:hypothetical protein LSH36_1120g01004 [Paralvinella palmiformis]